jgi:uncharacterized protein YecT (DUF1311 family)
MRRINPIAAIVVIAGLIILVLGILLVRARSGSSDEISGSQAASAAQDKTQQRCASQRTYDRIKEELFRRAVETRGSGRTPFDRLSSYAVVRMERPLLTEHDPELGTVRCAGRLSLDLPPGVAVIGGRRTLSADIDYVLQPAADGSGDVVMLEGADAIVVPLATLATTGAGPGLQPPRVAEAMPRQTVETPVQPEPPTIALQSPRAPAATRQTQPPARAAAPGARPSFNCRHARTRGEIAVCSDEGLAALDRQMAAQYYRAISAADARQRQLLARTRDAFLRFRDRCPSEACIADAYRGRMREIRDISLGR